MSTEEQVGEYPTNSEVKWLGEVYFVMGFVPPGSAPMSVFGAQAPADPESHLGMLASRFWESPYAPVESPSYVLSRGRLPKKLRSTESFVGFRFDVVPAAAVQPHVRDNTPFLLAMPHEELVRRHQALQAEYTRMRTALSTKAKTLQHELSQVENQRHQAATRMEELKVEVRDLSHRSLTMQAALDASRHLRYYAMQVIQVWLWLEDRADLSDERYERMMEVVLRRARRVNSVWRLREAKERHLAPPLAELERTAGLEDGT